MCCIFCIGRIHQSFSPREWSSSSEKLHNGKTEGYENRIFRIGLSAEYPLFYYQTFEFFDHLAITPSIDQIPFFFFISIDFLIHSRFGQIPCFSSVIFHHNTYIFPYKCPISFFVFFRSFAFSRPFWLNFFPTYVLIDLVWPNSLAFAVANLCYLANIPSECIPRLPDHPSDNVLPFCYTSIATISKSFGFPEPCNPSRLDKLICCFSTLSLRYEPIKWRNSAPKKFFWHPNPPPNAKQYTLFIHHLLWLLPPLIPFILASKMTRRPKNRHIITTFIPPPPPPVPTTKFPRVPSGDLQ